MEPWKPTDIVAIASLIGGIFGSGGGNELNSALTMQAFVERMGKEAGRKAWLGFRSKNDPEAPTTISKTFPYETRSAFAKQRPGPAGQGLRPRNRRSPTASRGGADGAGRRRPRSSAALAKAATPPTGSWSRRRSRPPATRSR